MTLATSYAVGDYFGLRYSLHRRWREARTFRRAYAATRHRQRLRTAGDKDILVRINLVRWPEQCAIVRFVAETMIPVDGGEVWAGDSEGSGPPVVLLHPGVGDSRIWDPVLPALTASWRVIRYDARGFGRSPAPTVKFTLLADLITVLDHFGLDRVAIVGCCWSVTPTILR